MSDELQAESLSSDDVVVHTNKQQQDDWNERHAISQFEDEGGPAFDEDPEII